MAKDLGLQIVDHVLPQPAQAIGPNSVDESPSHIHADKAEHNPE